MHLLKSSGDLRNKLIYVLLVLVVSAMAVGVAQYVAQGFKAITIPFPTSRPEAFVLDGVMRLAAGDALYRLLADAPMTIHVYNIFAYAVPAVVASPFSGGAETLLIVGRSIGLVSSVALAVMLGLHTYRISTSYLVALFAALSPFFFYEIALTQFFRLRPESPALLFSAAAIIYLLRSGERTPSLLCVAGLCFVSFMFKQSFIAAPVAIGLYFLLARRWRCLGVFSAAYGSAIVTLFIVMYGTSGYAYLDNAFVAMASNDVQVLEAIKIYSGYFFEKSFGLLLALPFALALAIKRISSNALIVCYFVTALVWNVYSSGKLGSSSNYYAEFGIASIIIIASVFRDHREDSGMPLLKLLVLLPIAFQVMFSATSGFAASSPIITRGDQGVDLAPYISRYQTNEGKLILHEKIAVQLGNPAGYDWFLLDILIKKGRFDAGPFFQRIRAGEFETIVFSKEPYSKFERDLYRVVLMSPYRKTYEDQTVMEFGRVQ